MESRNSRSEHRRILSFVRRRAVHSCVPMLHREASTFQTSIGLFSSIHPTTRMTISIGSAGQPEELTALEGPCFLYMSTSSASSDISSSRKFGRTNTSFQRVNWPIFKSSSRNWSKRTTIWIVRPKMVTGQTCKPTPLIIRRTYLMLISLIWVPSPSLLALLCRHASTLPSKYLAGPLVSTSSQINSDTREPQNLTISSTEIDQFKPFQFWIKPYITRH